MTTDENKYVEALSHVIASESMYLAHPRISEEAAALTKARVDTLTALRDQIAKGPAAWSSGIQWGHCQSETERRTA